MSILKFAALMGVLAVLIAGCASKDETTITGPDGSKMTASNDGKDVKVTTPDGEISMSSDGKGTTITDQHGNTSTVAQGVTEADLGVPLYPGGTQKPNTGFVSTQNGKKSVLCNMTSKDDPDKVIEFYKDKLTDPEPTSGTVGDMKSATIRGKANGGEVGVTAVKTGSGDTEISIAYQQK